MTTYVTELSRPSNANTCTKVPSAVSQGSEPSLERLERRLLAQLAQASAEYGLIEPNDRVMVAVSGGKDSFGLLYLLREIQKKAPFKFSIVAVNLDQEATWLSC